MNLKLLVVAFSVSTFMGIGEALGDEEREVALLIKAVRPPLLEALEAYEAAKTLPDEVDWYDFFGKTKDSNAKLLGRRLEEAADALLSRGAGSGRRELLKLNERIDSLQSKITEYKRQKPNAPSSTYVPFKWTRRKYDEAIDQAHEDIEETRKEIGALRNKIARELMNEGIDTSEAQVSGLFEAVTGEELVSLVIVSNNTRRVTERFKSLIKESSNDLNGVREYYGTNMMLLLMLERQQEELIHQIDHAYVPLLEKKKEQAEEVMDAARAGLEANSAEQLEKTYRTNLATAKAMFDVLDQYQKNLLSQRGVVQKRNERVAEQLMAARNTYETVKLGGSVASITRAAETAFDALLLIEVPGIDEFDSGEVSSEFREITEALKAR